MNDSSVAPPTLSLSIPPFFVDQPLPSSSDDDASTRGGHSSPFSSTTRNASSRDGASVPYSHDSPFSAFENTFQHPRSSPPRRSSLAPSSAAIVERQAGLPDSVQNSSLASTSSLYKPFALRSSMLDVFSRSPPAAERASSSRSVSPMSANGEPSQTLPIVEAKRRPFSTLLPREATIASSFGLRKLPSPLPSVPSSQNGLQSTPSTSPLEQRQSVTAYEFLNHEPDPVQANTYVQPKSAPPRASNGKGKQRAEVPIVELRILPVTDAINMFGSTQTSSNYSLSGKVVVRVHNIVREISANPQGKGSRANDKNAAQDGLWLPEISAGSIFLDPEEFLASQLNSQDGDMTPPLRVQEINITSLSCTFSGFALYVDHSGRFSACRLTESVEELLPNGFTVKIPELGMSQEYEIEFNLSIPGWLPGSMLTRFGGVFYSLEARANYTAFDSEQQHAIPSSLVPPRRASIMPESPSESDTEPASVPLRWKKSSRQLSDGESVGRGASEDPKVRSNSTPLIQTKSNWLGKRAKQLSIKAKSPSTSNAASSSNASLQSSSSPAVHDGMPPRLYASRDFISAFSDPIVIVIRRCREVVPVPVARMALVGADGAFNGATLDPPRLPRVIDTETGGRPDSTTMQPSSSLAGPPVAPTTFTVPNDAAKAAAHVRSHGEPRSESHSHRMPNGQSSDTLANGSTVPMRHFLHRPMLHPPADANIPLTQNGLPFSLTLSLPSYVAVDGPNSDILNFGVQIEVGRSSTWSRVRELGGLRLRSMELSCIQTERHCSVASRTFCHAYPLPPEPQASPFDLPVFAPPAAIGFNGRQRSTNEIRQRRGYERGPVQYHIDLLRAGNAPHPSANNVERVRTVIVGPPPTPSKASKGVDGTKSGKDRESSRQTQRRSPPRSGPSQASEESSTDPTRAHSVRPDQVHDVSPDDVLSSEAGRRATGRGRRAYQSAIRGLSNFATAVMDISFDADGSNVAQTNFDGSHGTSEHQGKRGGANDATRAALYSFAGSDGHGVDLTRGRVRMAIKLPMVSSSASRAKSSGTPQLIPDFESPFTKTRHKLQVKLGFGFGNKPLGGEGDWGQSLVMCVPVRFTESAPREVKEQFAPMPIRQVALGGASSSAAADSTDMSGVSMTDATSRSNALADVTPSRSVLSATPVLPSYNQLFREDGSRLADEGEDLPQYPGPQVVLNSQAGSVTGPTDTSFDAEDEPCGPSPAARSIRMSDRSSSLPGQPIQGAESSTARLGLMAAGRMHSYDNRIAPSRVLDESIPASNKAARALQRIEIEEMHRDERNDRARRMRRLSSRTGGAAQGGEMELETGVEVSGGARRSSSTSTSSGDGVGGEMSEDEPQNVDDDSRRGSDAAAQLIGETVNVDEMDAFDDEVPAFAARASAHDHDDDDDDDDERFSGTARAVSGEFEERR